MLVGTRTSGVWWAHRLREWPRAPSPPCTVDREMVVGLLEWLFGRPGSGDGEESHPRPPDWNLTLADLAEEE